MFLSQVFTSRASSSRIIVLASILKIQSNPRHPLPPLQPIIMFRRSLHLLPRRLPSQLGKASLPQTTRRYKRTLSPDSEDGTWINGALLPLTFLLVGGGAIALANNFDNLMGVGQLPEISETGLGKPQSKITDRVYFDVQINNNPTQRITMGLYGDDCPRTVENFKRLCKEGVSVPDAEEGKLKMNRDQGENVKSNVKSQ